MDKKVPDKYFEKFPDDLMKKLELMEDDLKGMAPTLLSLNKRQGYSLPQDYFSDTEEIIHGTVYKQRRSSGTRQLLKVISMAACVIIISIVGLKHWMSDQVNDELQLVDVLDYLENEPLEEELLVGLSDFSGEELVELVDGLTQEEIDTYIEDILDDFSDQELSELF